MPAKTKKKANNSSNNAMAKPKKTNDKSETIDLRAIFQPHYYPLLQPENWTKYTYFDLYGGRSSFKSSTLASLMVYQILYFGSMGRQINFAVLRKVGTSLRDTVYAQIRESIDYYGLTSMFKFRVNPLTITYLPNGSSFYFYGLDDYSKLKSNTIPNMYGIWYEEAAEFSSYEEFDQNNATFMRHKPEWADHTCVYYSYNPPRNPYNWINDWTVKKSEDKRYYVDKSDYTIDELGFNPRSMIEDIEITKKNDPDYYRYMWLGEAVGNGINVYNFPLFKVIPELRDTDQLVGLYYGMDVGHEVSATTCVCVGLTQRKDLIVLETYYYSPAGRSRKKSPSELATDVSAFINDTHKKYGANVRRITIDSAEGGLRNQLRNDYNISPHPVQKLKKLDMIDRVQSMLAKGRVYVLGNHTNDIFLDEHKTYHYEEKTLQSDDVRVFKEHDHTCDAFQYVILDNERTFR